VSADESTGRVRGRSSSLSRAHTADLNAAERAPIRVLLDEAFEGDFADDDWEHALGGVHVLAWDDGELVGHASVVQRRLTHRGLGIRTGYVEAVAVRADRRGRGLGSALMAEVEDVVCRAYDLGALSAGGRARRLYQRRGWTPWAGETWVLSPEGPLRTEDEDGGVYVLSTPTSPELVLSQAIACDWRPGDVW
jgi:aminoglycoside 2'-N-acetyltransferase I